MPPCPSIALLTAADEAALLVDLANYPPYYDESFDEVRARITNNGYANKLDIGGLAFWKRVRCDTPWTSDLLRLPEATVIAATTATFAPLLTPVQRVNILRNQLRHGMGGDFAIGSAILTAWNPEEFAVTDVRARGKLERLLPPLGCVCDLKTYPTYLEHVCDIRDQLTHNHPPRHFSAREVDQALWQ